MIRLEIKSLNLKWNRKLEAQEMNTEVKGREEKARAQKLNCVIHFLDKSFNID